MPKRKAEEDGQEVDEDKDRKPSTAAKRTDGDDGDDQGDGLKSKAKDNKSTKRAKKPGDGSGVSNKIELGKKKYVDVREFKGMIIIDIREYYESGGEMKPGKKGIALNPDQWEALKDNMDNINAKVEALQ